MAASTTSNFELAHDSWGAEEVKELKDVIASRMFTMGKKVAAFEAAFAKRFERKYAVMVNSGSSANLIAVASLFFRKKNPLKRGDEVIVPCVSWSTTYHPLQQYGLKLRFVDVDLDTLNYDMAALAKAITPKTRMIVSVGILGNPVDYGTIGRLCEKHDLIHFDDNCESMGATFKGSPAGSFGELSTFSTFFSHHISTMEGGLVTTDDKELYNLLRSLRNHGWTRDQEPDSPIFERRKDDFFEAYRFILPGYNVRPGELQGAVGLVQLKKLDSFLKIRRQNAKTFHDYFGNDDRFLLQKPVDGGVSSFFSFTMIAKPGLPWGREKVLPLLKKAKIGYRIITGGCFLRHDAIKYFDHAVTGRKNADLVHDRGWFIGNHPVDLRKNLELLHKALKPL